MGLLLDSVALLLVACGGALVLLTLRRGSRQGRNYGSG